MRRPEEHPDRFLRLFESCGSTVLHTLSEGRTHTLPAKRLNDTTRKQLTKDRPLGRHDARHLALDVAGVIRETSIARQFLCSDSCR